MKMKFTCIKREKRSSQKKLLVFDECCACEEKAGQEMNSNFCSSVTFFDQLICFGPS